MLNNGGECKRSAQVRAVAEGDPEIRRDENLERQEKWFELHLEALGTLNILSREVTSWTGWVGIVIWGDPCLQQTLLGQLSSQE